MVDPQITERSHEFGVKKKSGTRVILEDECNVIIGVRHKYLVLVADNSRERFTICSLIRYVMEPQPFPDDPEGLIACPRMKPSLEPIKEGYLEKKGNAAIIFWEKRYVRVKPGLFAYYKPKKNMQYALHIIPISQGVTVLRNGVSGFDVTVKQRTYSFRMINDPKNQTANDPEYELSSWMLAFENASSIDRGTVYETNPNRDSVISSGSTLSSIYGRNSICSGYDASVSNLGEDSDSYSEDESCDEFTQRGEDSEKEVQILLTTQLANHREKQSKKRHPQNLQEAFQRRVLRFEEPIHVDVRSTCCRDQQQSLHLSVIAKTEPLQNLTKLRPCPPSFNKKHGDSPVPNDRVDDSDSGNETAQSNMSIQSVSQPSDVNVDSDNSNTDIQLNRGVISPKAKKPTPLPRNLSLKKTES
ncbi:hypothetical protein ScPMuIL_001383 [Solemya velum]